MTDADVRGICPVCNRSVALLKDGRVGRHGSKTKGQWPPLNCVGWGQLAKADPQ